MFKFLYLFAFTIAVVSAGKMNFIDCGNHEVISLDVANCSGNYCILHRGKDVSLEMVYVSNQDSERLQLLIEAEIDDVNFPIPGIDTNGCHYVKCPIVRGKTYDIKYTQNIPEIIPNVKANVTARILGDYGLAGCIKVEGEIQD